MAVHDAKFLSEQNSASTIY